MILDFWLAFKAWFFGENFYFNEQKKILESAMDDLVGKKGVPENWRKDKKTVTKLIRTARRCARNYEILTKLTAFGRKLNA